MTDVIANRLVDLESLAECLVDSIWIKIISEIQYKCCLVQHLFQHVLLLIYRVIVSWLQLVFNLLINNVSQYNQLLLDHLDVLIQNYKLRLIRLCANLSLEVLYIQLSIKQCLKLTHTNLRFLCLLLLIEIGTLQMGSCIMYFKKHLSFQLFSIVF